MKRIILHWTAGKYIPNECDLLHYHYVIDSNGLIYSGKYRVTDNEICKPGRYAMHTGGGNTGSIGVAMSAMYGFKSPMCIGDYPITKKQLERTFRFCAELLNKYNIILTPTTLLTHYEFGQKHPKTSSFGKIDITYLPPYPEVTKDEAGSFIRSKVKWYLNNI